MKPCLEQMSMFYQEASHDHANRFPWLESKKVRGMTVTYGRRCCGLSGSLGRVGYLVRTYLESCGLPLPTLQRVWSVKDITSSCLILKLRLWAPRTGGSESPSLRSGNKGLWKTPVANDAPGREFHTNSRGEPNLSAQAKMWPTPTTRDHKDGSAESCKNVRANGLLGRVVHLWPTPIANDAVKCGKIADDPRNGLAGAALWATPTEGHAQGSSGGGQRKDLRTDVGGQLNPMWVEWLMGFPVGWTDLNA